MESYHLNEVSLRIGSSTYAVDAFTGQEAINRPYSFKLNFTTPSDQQPIQYRALVGQACVFTIKLSATTRVINAVILSAGRYIDSQTHNAFFVEIGPSLALRGLSRRSQIYGKTNSSLSDILAYKLGSDNSGRNYETDKAAVKHRISLSKTYELDGDSSSGSLSVQYQETDLNYINRICEAAGIFYFFTNDNDQSGQSVETVVFVDRITSTGKDPHALFYSPTTPLSVTPEWVSAITCEETVASSKYVVRGILDGDSMAFDGLGSSLLNDGAPDKTGASATQNSLGVQVEYVSAMDFHEEDFSRLAKTRSASAYSHQKQVTAQSSDISLSAASRVTITNSPIDVSTEFFIETIVHAYGSMERQPTATTQTARYTNHFEAVHSWDDYRPRRILPKPVMSGVYYATVMATTSPAPRSEINDSGRYRIQIRFDEASFVNNKTGIQGWYVRLAEPYSGTNGVGMHFPLLEGTEVLVAFVQGDPDRPVIVGTVATRHTPNLVGLANHTYNRVKTPSGAMIEIDDGAP